jgi:hypothetical protein
VTLFPYTTLFRSDKLRAAYIKAHPNCERCGALGPAGMIVDHKVPKRLLGGDVWGNCQTLCRSCHGAKTADDMRLYGGMGGGAGGGHDHEDEHDHDHGHKHTIR